MRAGTYAEFRGRTYRCGNPDLPQVPLLVDGSEPQPEGFERGRKDWIRRVDRRELTRLMYVETHALWRGRRVEVVRIDERDDEALIQQNSWDTPHGPTVQVLDKGLWGANVPISELTDVVEDVSDYPL
jgi:hypothetical protein